MSSRLLAMKFMQRGAASAPSSPATTPDNRPAKRQRLSEGFPASPSPSSATDSAAVRRAIADEEAKRQDAIEREAARRGESKWYLDVQSPSNDLPRSSLRIVSAGLSSLDHSTDPPAQQDSDEEDDLQNVGQPGRRTFGKPIAKQTNQTDDDHEDDNDEAPSDGSSNQHDSESTTLDRGKRQKSSGDLRAKLKAKRKADASDSASMAGERRSKHVKLNKLTSISSAGRSAPAVVCHACGQKGHIKAQCTNVRRHSRKTL